MSLEITGISESTSRPEGGNSTPLDDYIKRSSTSFEDTHTHKFDLQEKEAEKENEEAGEG